MEAFIDEENQKVEWCNNMPIAIGLALATFKFFDLKRHPKECLLLAVNQVKDVCESLRPKEEINAVLQG